MPRAVVRKVTTERSQDPVASPAFMLPPTTDDATSRLVEAEELEPSEVWDATEDAASSLPSSGSGALATWEENGLAVRTRASAARGIRDIFGEASTTSFVYRLYNNVWFSRLSTAVTAFTCVVIAIDADMAVSHALSAAGVGGPDLGTASSPITSVSLQRLFVGWLAIEVVLGVVATRAAFIMGPNRYWNLLDVLILLASFVATMTTDVAVSFTRVLRIARVSRALRAVRFVRYSEGLQRMATSFFAVMLSLFWVGILLFILFYIVGVAMMEGVATFLEERVVGKEPGPWRAAAAPLGLADAESLDMLQALQIYYGGVSRTWVTLFRAVSGSEWSKLAAPLAATHWIWSVVWLAYVFVVLLGVLNMVIGIVADIVRRPLPHDMEVWLDARAKEERAIAAVLTDALARGGREVGSDGRVSKAVLRRLLASDSVAKQLRGFGVVAERVGDVGAVMPRAAAGATVDEVARVLQTLRGEARAEDLLRLTSEVHHLAAEQATMSDLMQEVAERVRNVALQDSHLAMM